MPIHYKHKCTVIASPTQPPTEIKQPQDTEMTPLKCLPY